MALGIVLVIRLGETLQNNLVVLCQESICFVSLCFVFYETKLNLTLTDCHAGEGVGLSKGQVAD